MGEEYREISIHASAKEATTQGANVSNPPGGISIHASAKEATIPEPQADKTAIKFQSTPPRRRRHRKNTQVFAPDDFNPRLREGGDFS